MCFYETTSFYARNSPDLCHRYLIIARDATGFKSKLTIEEAEKETGIYSCELVLTLSVSRNHTLSDYCKKEKLTVTGWGIHKYE